MRVDGPCLLSFGEHLWKSWIRVPFRDALAGDWIVWDGQTDKVSASSLAQIRPVFDRSPDAVEAPIRLIRDHRLKRQLAKVALLSYTRGARLTQQR